MNRCRLQLVLTDYIYAIVVAQKLATKAKLCFALESAIVLIGGN